MRYQLRFTCALFLFVFVPISPCATQTLAQGPLETTKIRVQEGTNLAFDLSRDGRSIVLDLLGQLWLVPADGGTARPITDAVRDIAEDLDPSFSPDGRQVVFRGERNGRTGLWLLNINAGGPRQLTQLPHPDGYDGDAAWSPDGRVISFVRIVPPSSTAPLRSVIMLLDPASATTRELSITEIPKVIVNNPVWVSGGKHIAFVTRNAPGGGQIWSVPVTGGKATPITKDSAQASGPSFTPDGRFLA